MRRIAVLTISDRSAAGLREDLSGQLAENLLRAGLGDVEVNRGIVPDDGPAIEALLRGWADDDRIELIVTTGGTGISPRDVTPEATASVVDYQVPGVAELMRAESLKKTPMAALSRAIAGVRGRTLIVNLPGAPRAVEECLAAIMPLIPHALDQLETGGGH